MTPTIGSTIIAPTEMAPTMSVPIDQQVATATAEEAAVPSLSTSVFVLSNGNYKSYDNDVVSNVGDNGVVDGSIKSSLLDGLLNNRGKQMADVDLLSNAKGFISGSADGGDDCGISVVLRGGRDDGNSGDGLEGGKRK